MKIQRSLFLVLLAMAAQAIFVTGCTNTARGVKADTNNAAEHVERATR